MQLLKQKSTAVVTWISKHTRAEQCKVNPNEAICSAFKTLFVRKQDFQQTYPVLNDKYSELYYDAFINLFQTQTQSINAQTAIMTEESMDLLLETEEIQEIIQGQQQMHGEHDEDDDHNQDNYHYNPFAKQSKLTNKSRTSIASVVEPYRSKFIDMKVVEWADRVCCDGDSDRDSHRNRTRTRTPSTLHIIELGIGFDSRFERLFYGHSLAMPTTSNYDFKSHTMGSQHISMSDTRYDAVFYYELDLEELICIRQAVQHQLNLSTNMNMNQLMNATNMGKLERRLYPYSVLDEEWVMDVKHQIHVNNNKSGYQYQYQHNDDHDDRDDNENENINVCIICEALFIHLSETDRQTLLRFLCANFENATFICDETIDSGGAIDIQSAVQQKNNDNHLPSNGDLHRTEIKEEICLFSISEIRNRLALFTQLFVVPFLKKNYKILVLKL